MKINILLLFRIQINQQGHEMDKKVGKMYANLATNRQNNQNNDREDLNLPAHTSEHIQCSLNFIP